MYLGSLWAIVHVRLGHFNCELSLSQIYPSRVSICSSLFECFAFQIQRTDSSVSVRSSVRRTESQQSPLQGNQKATRRQPKTVGLKQNWSQTIVWFFVSSSAVEALVRRSTQISEPIDSIRKQASVQFATSIRLPFRLRSVSSQAQLVRFSSPICASSRQLFFG